MIKLETRTTIAWQEIKLPAGLTLEISNDGRDLEVYQVSSERWYFNIAALKEVGQALIDVAEEIKRVQDSSA